MPDRAYSDSVNENLHDAVSAWFLGPQGENADMLKMLFEQAVNLQKNSRLAYYPEDGEFITNSIQESPTFKQHQDELVKQFELLTAHLFAYSIPFFSQRYAGHMSFEMGLPGILGWVATVLNNPNNVAFEASPITTLLEIDVGHDMCEMLGYNENDSDGKPLYWGAHRLRWHRSQLGIYLVRFASSVSLHSSLTWSRHDFRVARNLKYYPLSLRDAMKPGKELQLISDTFKVPLPNSFASSEMELLSKLDLWQLLNLPPKTILDIPRRLEAEYGITPTYLDAVLANYIVQTRGKQAVEQEWGMKTPPRYFISATKHYSWPKGAALAGLGSENMIDVPIDINAHIDTKILRGHLQECLNKQIPVFAVVGIIGSTEEGCVDPLDEILDMRDEFEAKGLCFLVHADAAWGGYFASMIRERTAPIGRGPKEEPSRDFVPTATLRPSTVRQFEALARTDSITIDPHKAGYVPYPAGGLCYRDGRMRYLVTWSAPVPAAVGHGRKHRKPGAAAVATYMHHQVIGLHKDGHGALLGEVSWSCRRIAAHWAAMSVEKDPFIVVPLNPLSSEPDQAELAKEKDFIRTHILGKSNEAVVQDKRAMALLSTLGSDLNINAFACNFRINGAANIDVEEANYLNNAIFKRLSITTPNKKPEGIPMFLSATTFKVGDYGACVKHFKERLQLETESNQDLFLAGIFQGILEEEMKHVIARNTITKQTQSFVLQGYDANMSSGTGKAFLIYRPYFHNANGRFQVILSAEITDHPGSASKKVASDDVLFLATEQDTNVSDIAKPGASFQATISTQDASGAETVVKNVQVSILQVIKNTPLDSYYRDDDYPSSFVPFYLFSVNNRLYIDHALVKAPNAQMCAEITLSDMRPGFNVKEFDLGVLLDAAQDKRDLLLSVSRPEVAMQPADALSTKWFVSGTSYRVAIYKDTKDADSHGPGLLNDIVRGTPLATGTMAISRGVYVDFTNINKQEFTERDTHRFTNFTSREAHPETKAEWRKLVYGLRGQGTLRGQNVFRGQGGAT
ncbi:PLP-dependent transferase [Mycena sanguinolenta]|uniref:PLP-dependent transferase n=1 Tax=Mycena sanguinolenta TaxID=230812 RepID=A0A8H6Z9E0_9AGAR|nr:PLP-dependent transferase [Mycena sanguinolenta]